LQADEEVTDLLAAAAEDTDTHSDEVVRVLANLSFDAVRDDPAFWLQHALWTRAHVDEDVRDGLRRLNTSVYDTMVPLYAEVLRRSRRRMASPFTVQTMAVALASLVEGLMVRRAVDPGSVPDELGAPPGATASRDRHWTTFASVAHALLVGMTEPDDGPEGNAPDGNAPDRETTEGPR
jgi:hypothetical protein